MLGSHIQIRVPRLGEVFELGLTPGSCTLSGVPHLRPDLNSNHTLVSKFGLEQKKGFGSHNLSRSIIIWDPTISFKLRSDYSKHSQNV